MIDKPAFLITIDTEGDDLWARPTSITTANVHELPRFQDLCERFGFKPTWLTNYEMVQSRAFVEFAHDLLKRGTGEVGMHLHAWNSPPLTPLTADDMRHQPFLIEYPEAVMRDKIAFLTDKLEDKFGTKMRSHRAGRWALNGTYAKLLAEQGYDVDCSVTPHISWREMLGDPSGRGGSDYASSHSSAYFADLGDPRKEGNSRLLEVPMTIQSASKGVLHNIIHLGAGLVPGRLLTKVAKRFFPTHHWLRPNGRNLPQMKRLVDDAVQQRAHYIEFMLHSSELAVGTSPKTRTQAMTDRLYSDIEELFTKISKSFAGATLSEYRDTFEPPHANRHDLQRDVATS